MKVLTIFMVSCILVTGCCTQRRCADKYPPVQSVNDSSAVTTNESVQERDSISWRAPDSSLLIALIECDQQGQALLKQLLEYKSGAHTQVPVLELKNNKLTVRCKVDSLSVYNKFKTHFKSELKYRDREVVKEKRVNYLTDLQKAQINGFYIACSLLLLLGALFIYKITH